MNRRTFGIVAGVAVALVLLAILGQNRSDDDNIAGASAGGPLFAAFPAEFESIHTIEIAGAGNELLLRLERGETNWTVAQLDDYPAEPTLVNSLLLALAEARIVEEKTANPDFHSRLGVESVANPDASGLQVALLGNDDLRLDVILGDPYTGTQRYARLTDSDLSVLIDRNPDVASNPADWLNPGIIDIAGERVQRVEIAHADGERLVLSKQTRADTDFGVEGIPDGRDLQYTSIANVSGTVLQDLELDEVAAATAESGETIVTGEFRTFDGLVVTVTITAADGEDPWLDFNANFDAEQALAFATTAVDDVAGETASTDDNDALAEAEAINTQLNGWRYRIPSYKYSQLTRRMEDLLEALPADDE